jgi:hypothetical protein
LRVGQKPGLDELRQQLWNNRVSGQAEDFGGAYMAATTAAEGAAVAD